jgi:hypothetical protein
MADLSKAANAFAVVGLADVVFRLGIEASEIYSRCRNASRNVFILLSNLQTLADIIAKVRAFADDYSREYPTASLPELESALRDCQRELEDLKRTANSMKTDPNDT